MLYCCWHVEGKHPVSFHKLTPYFPKLILHYLFPGEGEGGKRWQSEKFSQVPSSFQTLSKEERGEYLSLGKKRINSVASARVNINSEMTTQEDVFISVERSNSKLSLIALCNPDASPASFFHLFKGT